jgi:hypothetical protein
MLKMLFSREVAEWLSASFVIIAGGLAGHYASAGMNSVQWAGAITAVLGAITVAVSVRVWPEESKAATEKARRDPRRDD